MKIYTLFLLPILLTWACRNAPAEDRATSPVSPEDEVEEQVPEPDSIFPIEYLIGKFNPTTHPDFVKVAPAYANTENYYLHREAYDAFQKMHAAAQSEGIKLTIISATRNFERQRSIWNAKWTGNRKSNGVFVHTISDPKERALEILKVSSMPGTSRHHWGTDMDLNAVNNTYFEKGEGQKVYDWLLVHAAGYGFCQPYTAGRPTGYTEEKWHWSYQPLASQLTKAAAHQLSDEQISGFMGDDTAVSIEVVKNYILGVNAGCL